MALFRIVAIMRLWVLHHFIDFEHAPELLTTVYTMIDALAASAANFDHDLLVTALEARGLESGGRTRRMAEEKFADVLPGSTDTITMKRLSVDKNGTLTRRRQSMKVGVAAAHGERSGRVGRLDGR